LIIAAFLHSRTWGIAVLAGCVLAGGLLVQAMRVSRLRREQRSASGPPAGAAHQGGANLHAFADPDKVGG
jgi:hypothetical protein